MDTTHAQLCGCSDEACVWQDGRTWDVVRLDETLERVIIARYLDWNEAFGHANLLQQALNTSAPIVYIVCAPEGVISFSEVAA